MIQHIGPRHNKSNLPKLLQVNSPLLQELELADNEVGKDHQIDILLGIPDISRLIKNTTVRINSDIVALDTELGFILCGTTKTNEAKDDNKMSNLARTDEWDKNMKTFWELDTEEDTDEDKECEEFYKQTFRKLPQRYEVGIPFKQLEIGESEKMAYARYHQIRRKLDQDAFKSKLY